jgi:hypothetical protein
MTGRTRHIFVSPFEGEFCFVVIEERWFPLVAVVTSGAVVGTSSELAGMRVFVAFYACFGHICELHMLQIQLHVGWLVTVGACDSAMGAKQGKAGLFVVEF